MREASEYFNLSTERPLGPRSSIEESVYKHKQEKQENRGEIGVRNKS